MHYNQNGDKLIAGRIFDIMINWKLVLRKHYLIMIIWKIPTFPRKDYWFSFYKSLRCSWVIGKRNFRPWMLCFSLSLKFLCWISLLFYFPKFGCYKYFFFRAVTNAFFVWRSAQNVCAHPKKRWQVWYFEYLNIYTYSNIQKVSAFLSVTFWIFEY